MVRKIFFLILFAYGLMFAGSLILFAQQSSGNSARGLFEDGKADGLKFQVLQLKGSRLVPVDPGISFHAGDKIKFKFEGNFEGRVYLVNVTPFGKIQVLFPRPGDPNRIVPHQTYEFPAGDKVFVFDQEQGTELIQVYLTRSGISVFDQAIRNTNGILNTSEQRIPGMVAESPTPNDGNETGVHLNGNPLPELQMYGMSSRGVVLSSGKQSQKKPTVVVVSQPTTPIPVSSPSPSASGHLQPGEVGIFEIRLSHQS